MCQLENSDKVPKFNPVFDFTPPQEQESRNYTISEGLKNNWVQSTTGNIKSGEEVNITTFPIDVFPQRVQEIIKATNRTLNYPIDFTAISMLYTVSVALGNTHKVEVKKTWEETAVLYLAIVGNAGTNKSHPLSFVLKPITKRDSQSFELFQTRNKDYYDSLKAGSQEVEKPIWEQHLLNDFTPESLIDVHKFNKRGIGVYVDELAGWINNFNRYSKGSEEQFWLSAWSGKPITQNRKSSDPVSIASPFISVIGTIQPTVLINMAKGRTDNGFMDRILFAYPDNLKKEYWNEEEPNQDHQNNWDSIIVKLLDIPLGRGVNGCIIPNLLKFDPGAKKMLLNWQKETTDKANESTDNATKSIIPKIENYAIRLSLVLEMMRFSCGESDGKSIHYQSVEGALKMANYFMEMAFKLQLGNSNNDPVNKLSSIKKTVYQSLPNPFKTSEGIAIAGENGMKPRTFQAFITDCGFFKKNKHGEYEKLL